MFRITKFLFVNACLCLSGRALHSEEKEWFTDYFKNIFTCNYGDLPPEATSHRDFMSQSSALRFMARCANIGKCKSSVKKICGGASTHERNLTLSWKNKCPLIIAHFNRLQPEAFTTHDSAQIAAKLNISLSHSELTQFYNHYKCVEDVRQKQKTCLKSAIQKCKTSRVQAVEVLRANLADLDLLIQEVPDIYVIYYVRDPRAIASSVIHVPQLRSNKSISSVVSEVKYVCSKMASDINAYEILSRKYPGVFLLEKYENLVLDSKQFGDRIYKHIGLREGPKEWNNFASQALHAKANKGGAFGVMRANGADSIGKWKKGLSQQEVNNMNEYCKEILGYFNYPV